VYGETKTLLISLNGGQDYWFAVDAFNENGVTAGEVLQMAQ
jgi:hypothetical protein